MNDIQTIDPVAESTTEGDQIKIKPGDGCWFEKRTGVVTLTRGMGMHPHPARSLLGILGLQECYSNNFEGLKRDLEALAERLEFRLNLYSEKEHSVHFTFVNQQR